MRKIVRYSAKELEEKLKFYVENRKYLGEHSTALVRFEDLSTLKGMCWSEMFNFFDWLKKEE